MKTNLVQDVRDRAPVEAGVTVKLRLDVHAAQITVCCQYDGRLPQPAQQLGWSELIALVKDLRERGLSVVSCYEAGPCGYGLHRQLSALGVTNYVVAPQRWDERLRRVKTDKRDARELGRSVRGQAVNRGSPQSLSG